MECVRSGISESRDSNYLFPLYPGNFFYPYFEMSCRNARQIKHRNNPPFVGQNPAKGGLLCRHRKLPGTLAVVPYKTSPKVREPRSIVMSVLRLCRQSTHPAPGFRTPYRKRHRLPVPWKYPPYSRSGGFPSAGHTAGYRCFLPHTAGWQSETEEPEGSARFPRGWTVHIPAAAYSHGCGPD